MIAKLSAVSDVIAPYLVYIKVGVFLLCVALSATLGYRYGTSTSRVEVAQLAAETASLRQANASYAKVVDQANAIVEANKSKAQSVQDQALDIGNDVNKANQQLNKKKIADLEQANKALKDARCQELMRMNVCANVPLP